MVLALRKHNGGCVTTSIATSSCHKLMMYKDPRCAFAAAAFRAKELKLTFISLHTSLVASENGIWAGEF